MSYYDFKNKPFFKTEKVYIETKIEEILVSSLPPKEKKKTAQSLQSLKSNFGFPSHEIVYSLF